MSRPHTSYHQRFEKLINYRFPLLYKCSYGRRYTLFQTVIFCPKIQLQEKIAVVNLIFKARAQAARASIFLYFLLVLLVSSICLKVKFCQNLIFGKKLEFQNSVWLLYSIVASHHGKCKKKCNPPLTFYVCNLQLFFFLPYL